MVIFEGQQLVAHWHEGCSDFLLVSFNQLNSEHAATEHFFLQPQVLGADISCVGVMTRERNFYLSPEMDQVVALVAEKRAGRPVIVFGQSMGGYAALKFSGRLGAECVIATSPFYSVNVDELEITDPRYRTILERTMAAHAVVYRPEFDTMALRASDIGGRAFVLYDPAEFVDEFAVRLIGKHIPAITTLTVPHAGHVIYDGSWSSAILLDMIAAARSGDVSVMAGTVNTLRHLQLPFLLRTFGKAALRKPRLCIAATRVPRITAHPDYHAIISDPFNLRAIRALLERQDHAGAAAHLTTVMKGSYNLALRPAPREADEPAADVLARHRCLVMSVHGSFLCWSNEHDAARFEPHPFRLTTRSPIVATLQQGVLRFLAISDGVERVVDPFVAAAEGSETGPAALDPLENGLVAVRGRALFVGATPDGSTQFLSAVTHQQKLALIPLQPQSQLFDRPSNAWLDRAALNVATPPVHQSAPPAQRRPSRWRRLFAST